MPIERELVIGGSTVPRTVYNYFGVKPRLSAFAAASFAGTGQYQVVWQCDSTCYGYNFPDWRVRPGELVRKKLNAPAMNVQNPNVNDGCFVVPMGYSAPVTAGQIQLSDIITYPSGWNCWPQDIFARTMGFTGPGQWTVTGATNATPIVITTSVANNLATGDTVRIASVGGNTAANGDWTITRISSTQFSLDTSVGSGAYTSGGTVVRYGGTLRLNVDTRTNTANKFQAEFGGSRFVSFNFRIGAALTGGGSTTAFVTGNPPVGLVAAGTSVNATIEVWNLSTGLQFGSTQTVDLTYGGGRGELYGWEQVPIELEANANNEVRVIAPATAGTTVIIECANIYGNQLNASTPTVGPGTTTKLGYGFSLKDCSKIGLQHRAHLQANDYNGDGSIRTGVNPPVGNNPPFDYDFNAQVIGWNQVPRNAGADAFTTTGDLITFTGGTFNGLSHHKSGCKVLVTNCSINDFNQIGGSVRAITNQTNAAAAVITTATHSYTTGDQVNIAGFTGNWAAANGLRTVTVLSPTTFSIPVDSTAFGAATGSPTAQKTYPLAEFKAYIRTEASYMNSIGGVLLLILNPSPRDIVVSLARESYFAGTYGTNSNNVPRVGTTWETWQNAMIELITEFPTTICVIDYWAELSQASVAGTTRLYPGAFGTTDTSTPNIQSVLSFFTDYTHPEYRAAQVLAELVANVLGVQY